MTKQTITTLYEVLNYHFHDTENCTPEEAQDIKNAMFDIADLTGDKNCYDLARSMESDSRFEQESRRDCPLETYKRNLEGAA